MSIYDEIRTERERQGIRWGGNQHDDNEPPMAWVDYITRYVSWAGMKALVGGVEGKSEYRRRMLQVAALAVAAVETFDRKEATTCPTCGSNERGVRVQFSSRTAATLGLTECPDSWHDQGGNGV